MFFNDVKQMNCYDEKHIINKDFIPQNQIIQIFACLMTNEINCYVIEHLNTSDQRGYSYLLHSKNENATKSYWKCRISRQHAKCSARAWTIGNKIIKLSGCHNHPPYDTVDTSEEYGLLNPIIEFNELN